MVSLAISIVPTKLRITGAREESRTKVDMDYCPRVSELSAYALRAENTRCMVSISARGQE